MVDARKFSKDFYTGVFFLAAGVFLYCNVSSLNVPMYDSLGSKFFPQVICIGAAVLGGMLAAVSLRQGGSREGAAEGDSPRGGGLSSTARARLLFVAVTVAYFLLMKFDVGFTAASSIYMFVLMTMLDADRRLPAMAKNALFSAVVSYATYYFFEKILMLLLP